MHYYHEFGASRNRFLVGLVLHLVAAAIIFLYVPPGLLYLAALAGVGLGAGVEYRLLIRHEIIRIRIDSRRGLIELQQAGQPYFYRKYKVYESRWFAILKLVDQQKGRTLILSSDCFNSVDSYRRLRFDLHQLAAADAA